MKEKPLQDIKDQATREHLRHIQENAKNADVLIFTAQPTADTLPDGEEAYYNTKMWKNVNGTIIYWSVTEA